MKALQRSRNRKLTNRSVKNHFRDNLRLAEKSPELDQFSGPVLKLHSIDKKIYVLGTAHISQESVNDVVRFIDKYGPDVVCVELCDSRYQAIMDEDRWRKLDIVEVIRSRRIYLLMSSMMLSAFQKKMGDEAQVKPGQEMIAAIERARHYRIPLELVDRDVQITLKRAWQSMGYFTKMMLISEMLSSLLFTVPVEAGQVEAMKRKDILDEVFDNLPVRFKKIKEIIITERDKYLATRIQQAAKKHASAKVIFAVVGAGHLPGIRRFFGEVSDLTKLRQVAQRSRTWAVIKFFFPIVTIMALFYVFTDTTSPDKVLKNVYAWIIIKATISGTAALLLLAHPLAVLGAALSSPISNFNPVLKPGWVAALIEAKYRRPSVADFETIATDTETAKGFFKNKVIRIFMIFTIPQLGSSVATGLALWYMSGT